MYLYIVNTRHMYIEYVYVYVYVSLRKSASHFMFFPSAESGTGEVAILPQRHPEASIFLKGHPAPPLHQSNSKTLPSSPCQRRFLWLKAKTFQLGATSSTCHLSSIITSPSSWTEISVKAASWNVLHGARQNHLFSVEVEGCIKKNDFISVASRPLQCILESALWVRKTHTWRTQLRIRL